MRRFAGLLFFALAATVLTGCTGAQAKRAESLLLEAQQAQKQVSSESFVMKFGIQADQVSGEFDMQGGTYFRGPHRGDFYMTMSGQGFPGSTAMDMRMARRGSLVTVHAFGKTESMSVPAAQSQLGSKFADMSQMLDFAQYVKSVSVDETDLSGRPADRIVGTIDMQRLLSSFGGVASSALSSGGVHLGDARVVLFVPRDTHLVEVMLADITINAHGQSARMHMSLALTGVNRPLSFPLL